MTQLKLKWRNDPAPTGRYRSFEVRGWPSAHVTVNGNEEPMFTIFSPNREAFCSEPLYPLKVQIAVWGTKLDGTRSFNWRTLKGTKNTVEECKAYAQTAYEQGFNNFQTEENKNEN
jgi:hypothetical protein